MTLSRTTTQQVTILIAPNVSEQMGGEAIKALAILRETRRHSPNTIQITHERCRQEHEDRLQIPDVLFVEDDWFSRFAWASGLLRRSVDYWFQHHALRIANEIIESRQLDRTRVIVHQTEPNSPVLPRRICKGCINVFGPINGNIYWPRPFRKYESIYNKLRRWLHMPLQRLHSCFSHGLKDADLILVAGGDRTRSSLLTAGCPESVMRDVVDCGIDDELGAVAPDSAVSCDNRFVHFGRLVFHKGTSLAIRSLLMTDPDINLDVIGVGPELEKCRKLAEQLKLQHRVRFLDWFPDRQHLFNALRQYRGMVLPSIEDANGIVVQESMALGLPPICLDWGGPQLLIEHGRTGMLVAPDSEDQIVSGLAKCMNTLGRSPTLAAEMGAQAREQAASWKWSHVMKVWQDLYIWAEENRRNPASQITTECSISDGIDQVKVSV